MPGARVLDLFAGSGQLGIEALSRGAKRCVFLDASREAIQIVLANCKTAGVFAQSRVIPDDAFHFLATTQEEFDLALLDPPYHHGTVAKALPQLAAHMAPGGVVLCETELDAELPEQVEGLVLAKQYKYGKILVSRYEKEEQAMNVEELLDLLEETLEAGTAVPFAPAKRVVDVDRVPRHRRRGAQQPARRTARQQKDRGTTASRS